MQVGEGVGHALDHVGGDAGEARLLAVQQHERLLGELVQGAQFLAAQVRSAQHDAVHLRRHRADRVQLQTLVPFGVTDEHGVAEAPGAGLYALADVGEEGVEEVGTITPRCPVRPVMRPRAARFGW